MMNRQEKIDSIIEFLDENDIKIIEISTIQGLIIDAQFIINQDENEAEYDELIERGLSEEDFKSLEEFMESKMWIMIKMDEVSGVSFDNCELSSELLHETELWKDEDEEE